MFLESFTVHENLWTLNFQSLLAFHDVHGHYNVPYHYYNPIPTGSTNVSPLRLGMLRTIYHHITLTLFSDDISNCIVTVIVIDIVIYVHTINTRKF
jgi:hypothetical protein